MFSEPCGPHAEYACAILSEYGSRPGQWISARRSRGNDRSEIESESGSARRSMSVSEREGAPAPSASRWSYPITSATAG